MPFTEELSGESIALNFIHYNGLVFGTSTRNEYRLTGLTRFLRDRSADVGDALNFSKSADGRYWIRLIKSDGQPVETEMSDADDMIQLSGTWKTIQGGRFA